MESTASIPSLDGRTLAFHARNNAAGTGTLMLVPVDGGEARPLLTIHRPESFWYGSFTWTPDGRRILAVRSRSQERPEHEPVSELWQVPVDGSAPTKIEFPG